MRHLSEQIIKEWVNQPLPEVFYDRELDLSKYLDIGVKKVVAVTGFRRVGKTFALLNLAKKLGSNNCLYVNLEGERIPRDVTFLSTLLDTAVEMFNKKDLVLLLDEVQSIPDWHLWANRINETTNHKIFISGSSSKLSSAELPTELRGRSLEIRVTPLSFSEFLTFKKQNASLLTDADQKRLLREYLTYGGLPEIVLAQEGVKYLIVDEYYKTFVQRDILDRYRIRNDQGLRDLMLVLLNSNYYTLNSLSKSLKTIQSQVGKATVSRYMRYLEQSFFVNSLCVHNKSIKNRLKAERKHYFVDSVFVSKYSSFSENMGRLMEHTVFSRILKDLFHESGKEVFYWKDAVHREVDFVIREKEQVQKLIQVSYLVSGQGIPERETVSLIKAGKELGCKDLLIVTWDLEQKLNFGDYEITALPLYKWLLQH